MQVEIINIFIKAAIDVLQQEVGEEATAGSVKILSSAQTSEEVSVMIGVTGSIRGMVLLGMSERTAKAIVARMMGEPCPLFDDLAQSGTFVAAPGTAGDWTLRLALAGCFGDLNFRVETP